jgi:hypothetical protein
LDQRGLRTLDCFVHRQKGLRFHRVRSFERLKKNVTDIVVDR